MNSVNDSNDFQDGVSLKKMSDWGKKLLDRRSYEDWIDNLDASAQMKNCLKTILNVTINIASKAYSVGKIVVDFIIKLRSNYPYTVDGAFLGFGLAMIITCIPFFGKYLGPVVIPFFTAAGGILGFLEDTRMKKFSSQIKEDIRKAFC